MSDQQGNLPAEDEVREPVPGPASAPVEQLAHLVPALWRTMKRASRAAELELPGNESQVTILRLVVRFDGLTTAQLADSLSVARSTVSNLLKGLVHSGLVQRLVAPDDARRVTIVPTEKGRRVLEEFRHDRTAVLAAALEGGPDQPAMDAARLAGELRQLLRRLEGLVQEPRDDGGHDEGDGHRDADDPDEERTIA
ncbi:MAG: MarR family winged helix-turn-helix transcriptional regulator [Propionicimonas sp.]|uniref:MarR family winged helix-turn-helix transcriptional regulator n=1 Tax=Propionicimonas sp. TaxID=1955623 RepID=UPI003D146063